MTSRPPEDQTPRGGEVGSGATTRVFLVDDHAIVRRGLASYLEGEEDLEVAGQADTGTSVLSELARLESAEALPDVVLMDLLMPNLDGVETTREVCHLGHRSVSWSSPATSTRTS
jgi:DNA-binding NarL/FixJ family response regulator